jgi:FkbH-like protein
VTDLLGHDRFAWRAPLSPDWTERWRELDERVRVLASGQLANAEEICLGLRRLANQRLGLHEQLKLEGTARRLLHVGDSLALYRPVRIGLLGNRTLSFLISPLRAAGLARGLLVEAMEAPYDSAARFAFGASDVFAGKKLDAVVVVLDEHAFGHPNTLLNAPAVTAAIDDAHGHLQRLARVAREQSSMPAIVATIPATAPRLSSADIALAGSDAHFIARLNMLVAEGAERGDWIAWDLAGLAARVGWDSWSDPIQFHEAKAPFAIGLSPLVADHLCRILAAMTGKSCRALVLDLDNTLWGGAIGDDGVEGIRLGNGSPEGEAYLEFQKFALDLRRRGVVLAVCSKNTDAVAREPFRTHPEMALKEDDIAIFLANWEDKAANIRAIAEGLNLGLESIAFADDNPAERERVRLELPLVTVPEIGDEPSYFAARIADSGAFEHLNLNQDDLGRAESYKRIAGVTARRGTAENYVDYLKSLQMEMLVQRFDELGRPRIAQLVAKSNQFNLTTRRYGEDQIRRFEEDERETLCWQVRLQDRFTVHGMIAVVIVLKNGKTWTIDTWLQSCRVLARGVEQTLMNLLVSEAQATGVEEIVGEYIPSARNEIVADFFVRMGFVRHENPPDGRHLYFCRPSKYAPLGSTIEVRRDGD